VAACPFGVVARDPEDGRAHKCTMFYDRQKDGIEPDCAQGCPTDSIQFGPMDTLRARSRERTVQLHRRGETDAYLYGAEATEEYGALNAFFLLKDRPSVYNLPEDLRRPRKRMNQRYAVSYGVALGLAAVAAFLPCPGLLIADLGRPDRFLYMLRVFKPSSPMNLGSWTLAPYSLVLARKALGGRSRAGALSVLGSGLAVAMCSCRPLPSGNMREVRFSVRTMNATIVKPTTAPITSVRTMNNWSSR
jgi:hypothetical protein